MSFEIVEKSQVNREITLTVPGSEVRSVESLMVENARRKMVVNGFRKGKVPASVVRERAGAAIMEDARQECLQKTAREAIATIENLLHVGEVDVVEPQTADGGFVAVLHAECTPTVELKPYNGIEVKVADVKVTDEDVEEAINVRLQRHATTEVVEGHDTVEDGDVVCCELSAPNDAAAKLCRAGERTICVGRGDLNVDMEKCLVGVKLGDSVTLTAKIGDEEPVVTAEVKEIKVRKVPELNDEFAKTTGEGETVAELREATRKTLVEEEEERRKAEIERKVLEKLRELMPVEIPEGYVKARAVQAVRLQVEQWLHRQVDESWLDQIAANLSDKELDHYRDDYRNEVILNAIAADAKIEVTHDEIVEEAMKWFGHAKKERVERWMTENNSMHFVGDQVKRDRALKLVCDAAVVTSMTDEEIAAEKEAQA